MELVLLFWIICGIGAAYVASSRGASGCLWAFIGFLLGPIGLLMAFASDSGRKCPHCQSGIHKDATRCPKCQAEFGKSGESPRNAENERTQRLVDALSNKSAGNFRCPKCKT